MRSDVLLIKPKITEKSMDNTKKSTYVFEVDSSVSKDQIKKAVQTMFHVTVGSIQTLVRKGKIRRVGKRQSNKKLSNKKIAYVHVTEGKIDLFPQA